MQPTLLANGRIQIQDPAGLQYDVGPEHPDYQRLIAQSLQPRRNPLLRSRLFGLVGIAIGAGAWWYNSHLAATEGHFFVKLTLLGPLGLFGGLLMLLKPEWAGPLRSDSTRAHKTATIGLIVLMLAASGVEYLRLKGGLFPQPPQRRQAAAPRPSNWSPASTSAPAANLLLLGKIYQLGSFHERPNPVWEFVTPDETVNRWTTILTLIDRPDAHTLSDLDRVSEAVMANYKAHSGQILKAKTMQDAKGQPYNYLVAAFEEPAQRRYEFDFVKVGLGAKNVTVVVYGVRVSGSSDYQTTSKQFLTRESDGIGRALASTTFPETGKLPRREF